jgi:transposase
MVTLSQKELQRVRVIEKAVDGRLSVREAACLLQRSERQVQRLKRRFQPNSVDWVRHGNRGKPRPWALNLELSQRVLELARVSPRRCRAARYRASVCITRIKGKSQR